MYLTVLTVTCMSNLWHVECHQQSYL